MTRKNHIEFIAILFLLVFAVARGHYELSSHFNIPFGDGMRYRSDALAYQNAGFAAKFSFPPGSVPFYLMARLFAIPAEFEAMRFINFMAYLLMAGGVYLIGRMLGGVGTGLISTGLVLLCPDISTYIPTYYTEVAFCSLFALSTYAMMRTIFTTKCSLRWPLVAAGLTYWGGLLRPVGFVIGLAAAIFFFFFLILGTNRQVWRGLMVFGIAILLLQSVFMIRNHMAYGEWTTMLPNGANSLFLQFNSTRIHPGQADHDFILPPDQTAALINDFKNHARSYDFILERLKRIFVESPNTDSYELLRNVSLPFFSHTSLMLLAVIGIGLNFTNPQIAYLALVGLLYGLFYSFIHVTPRYAIGLNLVASPIGGYYIMQLLQKIRQTCAFSIHRHGRRAKYLFTSLAYAGASLIVYSLGWTIFHPSIPLQPSPAPDVIKMPTSWLWSTRQPYSTNMLDLQDSLSDKIEINFTTHLIASSLPLSNMEFEKIDYREELIAKIEYFDKKRVSWGESWINTYPDINAFCNYRYVEYIPANTRYVQITFTPPAYGDLLEIHHLNIRKGTFPVLYKTLFLAPCGG